MHAVMTEVAGGASIPTAQPHLGWEALATLLADQELHGYSPYGGLLAPETVGSWLGDRARLICQAPEGLVTESGGVELVAAGLWRHLPWDTQMLQVPAGRIDFLLARGDYRLALGRKRKVAGALVEQARAAGVRHLSIRVDSGDLSGLHALQREGFELIDGIQTFALSDTAFADPGPASRGLARAELFSREDLEPVLAIARSSYRFDRFHADPALRAEHADTLHEQWVRNSCTGSAADAVLVARHDGKVLGFVTVKLDSELARRGGMRLATIVLVATAESARGMGIGRLLTLAAVRWALSQRAGIIQVGTQLRNVPAGRLYESCGFKLVATSLTLRALLF